MRTGTDAVRRVAPAVDVSRIDDRVTDDGRVDTGEHMVVGECESPGAVGNAGAESAGRNAGKSRRDTDRDGWGNLCCGEWSRGSSMPVIVD